MQCSYVAIPLVERKHLARWYRISALRCCTPHESLFGGVPLCVLPGTSLTCVLEQCHYIADSILFL